MRSFVILAALAALVAPAGAQQISEAAATAAVDAYAGAVASGEPGRIAQVLAPEFQIVRSSGARRDRETYLAGFPASHSVSGPIVARNIRVTGDDGLMVVSYDLEVSETIDGKPVDRLAPRLTVFRYIEGDWRVVAHANFAAAQ